MAKLSILIPARNEMFLTRTIQDILANIEGDTEVIAVLDGQWADPPIPQDPRVNIIYHSQSIGQRAGTNEAAKISKAKYVMKVDAHCAFDKGFDVKMMREMHDDWTMVPLMKNLHAFDWVCPDGHRRYQGPSGPCKVNLPNGQVCGKPTTRDILWRPKPSPNSVSYCFDATPHFQYFGEYAKRPEGQGEITETMSLQGSCWMLTRKKYWELNICDENFGSWGSQGIEVACKTWLSGGRVMVNRKTWYAHMFRTQGGDFGFPYPIRGRDQKNAQKFARDLFFNNKWPQQIRPLSWLVEKFWPVRGWTEEDLKKLKTNTFKFSPKTVPVRPAASEPTTASAEKEETEKTKKPASPVSTITRVSITTPSPPATPFPPTINKEGVIFTTAESTKPTKGIVYYTDNRLRVKIAHRVQDQLNLVSKKLNIPIISVSLKPMPHFGAKNIRLPLSRGVLTMFKQILAGLKASESETVFFCEHDCLYPLAHFEFTPPQKDRVYYNTNVWKLNAKTGHALHYDCQQTSGLCANRKLMIKHYQKRVQLVEKNGYTSAMGYEPGTHNRAERVDDLRAESWQSSVPIIDIRHAGNLSPTRWKKEQFRNQKFTKGWTESDEEIPSWGKTKEIIKGLN